MAAKKNPAMDFIVQSLEKNKHASYAEIAEEAKKRGYKIYPINYGRAKAMLKLVPVAARGQGGKQGGKKVAATAAKPGRGPGRPRKSAAVGGSLDAVIAALEDGDRERERFRRALVSIRSILQSIL